MLTDPLLFKAFTPSSGTALAAGSSNSMAVTDLSPGRTVRIGTLSDITSPGILTISHSVSKESPTIPTNRMLIRIDAPGYSEIDSAGVSVNSFAYLVVGVPQSNYTTANTPISGLVLMRLLVGLLKLNAGGTAYDETVFTRVLAGEP